MRRGGSGGSTCFWKARSDWTLFLISMRIPLWYFYDVRELGGHGCGRDELSVCWLVVVVKAFENRSAR